LPRKPENPIPWTCAHQHLLGHIERDRSGLKLILYAKSIDPRWPARQPPPEHRAILRGPATVRCTICYDDKEWFPDKEAIDRLINRVKDNKEPFKPVPVAPGLTATKDMA